MHRFHVTLRSGNKKTGPLVVTTSSHSTCPDDCPFKAVVEGEGTKPPCYAADGPLAWHWDKVDKAGLEWSEFTTALKLALMQTRYPVWRHNQAGNLPNRAGRLDRGKVLQLARISNQTGVRGFTYDHSAHTDYNWQVLREANASGFTVNVSCETEAEARKARAAGLPAALVVGREYLPENGGRKYYQKDGLTLRLCPAYYADTNCAKCRWCANPNREDVVLFPAHGKGANAVEKVLAKKLALELEVSQ